MAWTKLAGIQNDGNGKFYARGKWKGETDTFLYSGARMRTHMRARIRDRTDALQEDGYGNRTKRTSSFPGKFMVLSEKQPGIPDKTAWPITKNLLTDTKFALTD